MSTRETFLRRLGRHTARHRTAWIGAWTVLVALAFTASLGGLGPSLFDRLETGDVVAPGQALEGRELILEHDRAALPVLLRVDGVDLTDPRVTLATRALVDHLEALDGVGDVRSPMSTPGWPEAPEAWALVAGHSPDSDSFLVSVEAGSVPGSELQQRVSEALEAVGERQLGPLSDELTLGGTGLLVDDVISQVKKDLVVGEGVALPLSLLLMLVVFGGFVAAGLPIVGAIAVIASSLALLLGFSFLVDLDVTVVNIVTVMGLALCIDYGLLLVSRFREELERIAPGVPGPEVSRTQVEDALAAAVGTAGRTVAFSAVIVGISLSGLMIFEAPIVRAIGAAGVSVVMAALLVALTLVPALCSLGASRLTRRRGRGRARAAASSAGGEAGPDEGVLSRLAAIVQRRPTLTTLLSVAFLLVLALPALDLKVTSSGTELLPADAEQRVFFEHLQTEYPALASPAVTVVTGADEATTAAWARTVEEVDGVTRVDPVRQVLADDVEDGPLSRVEVHVDGGLLGEDARSVAATLRAADPGFDTWTTGQAAALQDFTDHVTDRAPWAVLWIAGATFVLLFLLTGSVVIPVKALILNVVSLGASIGILVWVFQQGHLEGLLHFQSVGAIEAVIPLMVLAFGFGLSMDYEVFLLARVLELHEQGYDDDTAVRLGLQRSGRIITSAALIMVIVFAGFAVGQMLVVKQTGVSLAVAVLLDATIVRMVIVPATMTMLGSWNWWAPRWMRRLHARFGVSEHGPPEPAGPGTVSGGRPDGGPDLQGRHDAAALPSGSPDAH